MFSLESDPVGHTEASWWLRQRGVCVGGPKYHVLTLRSGDCAHGRLILWWYAIILTER
eukprot:COSAG03_NODE_10872_length_624_cov_1.074286_1_plen_57_part_10